MLLPFRNSTTEQKTAGNTDFEGAFQFSPSSNKSYTLMDLKLSFLNPKVKNHQVFICRYNIDFNIYIYTFLMSETPVIKPIDIPEYKYKNSKYDMMPSLPFRGILVASSTGGKTVLIQNLILNIYKGSFERIFIFLLLL